MIIAALLPWRLVGGMLNAVVLVVVLGLVAVAAVLLLAGLSRLCRPPHYPDRT